MTSHAALVARQMGKVCVAGCGELDIDYAKKVIRVKGKDHQRRRICLHRRIHRRSLRGTDQDNTFGNPPCPRGQDTETAQSKIYQDFALLMKWADEARKLGIRTNADQPDQAAVAVAFGAEGIGLCRTEHMFFEGDRIDAVREMILADDEAGRVAALKKLLPMQKKDFVGLFKVMKGLPVTIRTLDPPLHEFLPHTDREVTDLAQKMGVSAEKVQVKIDSLHEANPMLGHRGCRLGIVFPEITEMQARAIFEAACEVKKKGINVKPEIMIPLVGNVNELKLQKDLVVKVAEEVFKKNKTKIDYMVGTMIEIPRAAITADEIATEAEFFSFGTNDLTQTTLGMSSDDAGKFLVPYVEKEIYAVDPFQRIDEGGVGKLMKLGVELGRSTRKNLKCGICGEHGGEPKSVEFCHKIGLNYVSCSPYRVTVAKLAAARAAIRKKCPQRPR